MSEVVRFRSAREIQAERKREELRIVARCLIDEIGCQAGYEVGLIARLPRLAPEARERRLAIVYEIERDQGFGWYFGDEEETA